MAQTQVDQTQVLTGIFDELPVVTESTTSRVVVNNPLMRVVYFSFDTGQLLTAHTSPRAVVVTILDGTMDFTVGGTTTALKAGDCVYLAPNDEHALTATSPCYMQLVMVDMKQAS